MTHLRTHAVAALALLAGIASLAPLHTASARTHRGARAATPPALSAAQLSPSANGDAASCGTPARMRGDAGRRHGRGTGASGGPWLTSFNGMTGLVNGVNSYGYPTLPGRIYSPHFGDGALALYDVTRFS
jgi:hypothetical protein